MNNGLTLALAALLVGLNAWFVAAEYAVVTVPRSRVLAHARAGGRRATALMRILDSLEAHVATIRLCTLGITLIIGWIGVPLVRAGLASPLALVGVSDSRFVTPVAAVVAFMLTATLLIVLGESLPKRLGLHSAERIALWSAHILRALANLLAPIRTLLSAFTSLSARVLGVGDRADPDDDTDQRELRLIISQLTGLGRLSPEKHTLLENLLAFSSRTARQIMVPRDRIQLLSRELPINHNLEIIRTTGHTRYPLCEDGIENIIGMIHIKDLFGHADGPTAITDLQTIRRNLPLVPETLPLDELQKVFEKERAHMAIVLDEHGGTIGLVTLEDVLEELVGDIHDEFDGDETPAITMVGDGLLVDGMMLVDDLCRELEVDPEDGEADTVGGYVTESLGKIGEIGDRFRLGEFDGRVTEMQGRRVSRIYLRADARGLTPSSTPEFVSK
jgi:CBS domain containing-hemolysin-like protein